MKKIMFLSAMLIVSAQAMNAAEKTASDKNAFEACEEYALEKAEVPSVESCEACDALVTYRMLTTCGVSCDVIMDSRASAERVMDVYDLLDDLACHTRSNIMFDF